MQTLAVCMPADSPAPLSSVLETNLLAITPTRICERSWNRTNNHGASNRCSTIRATRSFVCYFLCWPISYFLAAELQTISNTAESVRVELIKPESSSFTDCCNSPTLPHSHFILRKQHDSNIHQSLNRRPFCH